MSLWNMQFPGIFPLPWSKSIVLIPIPKKGNNTDSKISFNWLFSSHLDDFNKNYTYTCERNTLSIVINDSGKYPWFLIVRYHSLRYSQVLEEIYKGKFFINVDVFSPFKSHSEYLAYFFNQRYHPGIFMSVAMQKFRRLFIKRLAYTLSA